MLASFSPLLLFVLVSTITPGGATTLAAASGAHFGFQRSLPLIAGIAVGLATMAGSAAAGLAGALLAEPSLQLAMKAAGSIYLLWLALRIMRSGPPHRASAASRPTRFVGGLWMLWHNPKGWAMTLGAAASFSPLSAEPGRLALILGLSFGLAALLSLCLWCTAGLLLARIIRTEHQWRMLNGVLGLLLMISILPIWL